MTTPAEKYAETMYYMDDRRIAVKAFNAGLEHAARIAEKVDRFMVVKGPDGERVIVERPGTPMDWIAAAIREEMTDE